MWQEEFISEIKAAQPRTRKSVLKSYKERTGYSEQHLYRIARENGFDSGKKERIDKGALKLDLTEDQIEHIAAIIYETGRENKGPIMPAERAIQMAEDNGIIEPGVILPETLNRILREKQMSKLHMKADAPHTNMRSLHPNHVHLVDVSVCIQYYLKNGRLGIMDERDFYKNKPENFEKVKTRLLRYVLTDHFSGAFWFKYYDTTGETQGNLYDFLIEAWSDKNDERFPFRGAPFLMLMDTGAANKAKAMREFFAGLDIEIPKGAPYNPRRQGSVETTHKIIEEWFESGLRIQPAVGSVEQINEWAKDLSIWFHASKKHTRHKMTRTGCWMLIQTEQLRELPSKDLLQELYANPAEERTVDGAYAISFRGKDYNLKHIEGLWKTARVKVILKPFKWPKIDVAYMDKTYEASPVETLPLELGGFRADAAIIGQQYRAQPETLTQQAIKRFDNMAYGEEKKKDAIPFEGMQVFGMHADKVKNIAFIEKQGTPMEIGREIAAKNIPITELFKRLIRADVKITPELNQELRARYGESIEIKEAEEVIRRQAEGLRLKVEGEKKAEAM